MTKKVFMESKYLRAWYMNKDGSYLATDTLKNYQFIKNRDLFK
jgi:hypothetical protein